MSGFNGTAGDCAARAIAIAAVRPYSLVYKELFRRQRRDVDRRGLPPRLRSPRLGVFHGVWAPYLREIGWRTTAAPPRLRAADLPGGRLIVELSSHLTAVIDGAVHDSFDPRCGSARVVSIRTGPTVSDPLDDVVALQLFP